MAARSESLAGWQTSKLVANVKNLRLLYCDAALLASQPLQNCVATLPVHYRYTY